MGNHDYTWDYSIPKSASEVMRSKPPSKADIKDATEVLRDFGYVGTLPNFATLAELDGFRKSFIAQSLRGTPSKDTRQARIA